jgi:hypothetical protein
LDHYQLIERWTLIGDDLERMASKRSAAKPGLHCEEGIEPPPRPRPRPHQSVSGSACVRVGGFSFGGAGGPGR